VTKKKRLRPVGHQDRLTLVEHLDELRVRLIAAAASFAIALALCFWQNHLLLDIANRPLPGNRVPITFGVTEPLMTTVTVAIYGALLLSAPVILYQLYAFMLPALKPGERRVAVPLLLLVPVLFIAGALFAYFVVMPAAIKFLLNFNSDQFQIQVRAREYYGFLGMTLLSMGAVFQMPVVILGVTRLGVVTPRQLSENRRYAVLVIAVIAMLLPGTDPVSMLAEMVPLLLLYEFSIVLAKSFGTPAGAGIEARPSPQGR
jgi:sec-independent protein translocase protein TatC